MNQGPNLGSERKMSKHPAGGGLDVAPALPSPGGGELEFCPVEHRNVMKCDGCESCARHLQHPGFQPARLLASLDFLIIGACVLVARHIA